MRIFIFLATLLLCNFFGCTKQENAVFSVDSLFEQKIEKKAFKAKLAITPLEQAKGLMFLKTMPENEGMIFVYKKPQAVSYWMKNTYIPLDIAFINSEGVLLQIKQMYPLSEEPVPSASSDVLYCLEMNQGWFAKNKIKSGDKLDINLLNKALKLRNK